MTTTTPTRDTMPSAVHVGAPGAGHRADRSGRGHHNRRRDTMNEYGKAARDIAAEMDDYDDDPRSRPGVAQQMERLQIECDRFSKFASVLDERLGPVLSPETPLPETSGQVMAAPEPSSPLAGQIEDRTQQLRVAGARIDRLLKRIDV